MGNLETTAPVFKADGETISNGKTVLVVDDDPVFRKAIGIRLHFSGYDVRTAKENSEAIATLGQERIDAVIMDVQFPADVFNGGMGSWDGFQIMQWIRGLPGGHRLPFVIVSSSDSDAYQLKAQQLGAAAFLRKPVDYAQLVEVLNGATKAASPHTPSAENKSAVRDGQKRAQAPKAVTNYIASLRPSLIR